MMRSMMLIGMRVMIAAASGDVMRALNISSMKSTGLENSFVAPTMLAQNTLMIPPVMLAIKQVMSERISSSAKRNGIVFA